MAHSRQTHPMLELLSDQPVERLRWLIGAVVMEAAAVDAQIAFVFEAIPEPDDAEVIARWRRAAWGQSGERLALALDQSGAVWPKGPALSAEYRRLYELRNLATHGLHYPAAGGSGNGPGGDLAIESVRMLRVSRSAEAIADVDVLQREEGDLYELYCDLEELRRRVIDDAPEWF